MEHLTKQQIVLLTLLVSFVTSLSTGIVTVSLIDQTPSVTKTVNQIIERTVSSPQTAAVGVVSISVDDQIASATSKVASSTVKIQNAAGTVVGLGIVMSKDGVIMTDKDIINQTEAYSAALSDGTVVPVSINASSDSGSSMILLAPVAPYPAGSTTRFVPVHISSEVRLGQKVFSLRSASGFVLSEGIVTEIGSTSISVSMPDQNRSLGAPLFDIQGNIIGMQASSTFSRIAAR